MRRATAMLLTVLVLGSASLAAAECGWVLWEKVDTATGIPFGRKMDASTRWEIYRAYNSFESCSEELPKIVSFEMAKLEGLERKSKELKELGGKGLDVDVEKLNSRQFSISMLSEKEHKILIYAYYCLPDTIDPREKR